MEVFNVNLNIHFASSNEVWEKLQKLYATLPGWNGIINGIPTWYGESEKTSEAWDTVIEVSTSIPQWAGISVDFADKQIETQKLIEVSIEPSGLQFYAKMPKDEWTMWINTFKQKATELLGYDIGEPEDGYDFNYDM